MGRLGGSTREGFGFGLLLVALGVLLLAMRLGYTSWSIDRLWPWVVVGWGVVRIVGWASPRRIGGGVTAVLMGAWFLISVNEWRGYDWEDTWPLALVAVGVGIIVRVLLQRVWPVDSGKEGGVS